MACVQHTPGSACACWAEAKAQEPRVCKADSADRSQERWDCGACSGQVTVQTENYGSSLKWLQKVMALESRWKQEGKHTEHSVTSFSGKCPQALGPRVLYNLKQKGLQEIPLLIMSPLWETKG